MCVGVRVSVRTRKIVSVCASHMCVCWGGGGGGGGGREREPELSHYLHCALSSREPLVSSARS